MKPGDEISPTMLTHDADLVTEGGLDSIEALDILLRVEERFGITIADEDLSREMFRSFSAVTAYVHRRLAKGVGADEPAPSSPPVLPKCIKPLQRAGAKRPLFWVPGGGGGLAELEVYARVAGLIDPDRPVFQFVAPGLESDEPPCESAQDLAACFTAALCGLQPIGPVLLAGECVGGAIAFEMAQQFSNAGREVALLLIVDGWMPRAIPRHWLDGAGLQSLLARASRFARHQAIGHVKRAAMLVSDAFVADARESERTGRVSQMYQDAALRYQPSRYAGAVTLIVSDECARIDPTMGWSTVVDSKVHVHRVSGNHDAYVREHRQALAARIRTCLEGLC